MFRLRLEAVRRALVLATSLVLLPTSGSAQVPDSLGGRGSSSEAPGPFARPPAVPVLDAFPVATTAASVQLSGIAVGATKVEVQGPAGTWTTPVAGGAFLLDVPLAADVVNHLFVTAIGRTGVRGAPALAMVARDLTPPELTIESPLDGAQPTAATADVAGAVGDLLSGFQGLSVSVNGVTADVDVGLGTNGSFFAADVPLLPSGPTLLTVLATDALGNQASASVSVTRITPPAGSATLEVISGDDQTASAQANLAQPLVVRATRGDGSPFSGKLLSFEVTKSDGALATTPGGSFQRLLQLFTDANGEATAYWRLGSDAGCGNNRVEVRGAGLFQTLELHASATAMAATRVLVGTGDGQIVEAGATAVLPFVAWVTDGCNGVPGLPVTFTVVEGDGSFAGQSAEVVVTDATGAASIAFDVGLTPGVQRVEASITGSPEPPASFSVEALERSPSAATRFVGLVLDDGGLPLEGARVVLDVSGVFLAPVFTDAAGTFAIDALGMAGPGHLDVDASVATHRAGMPVAPGSFPHLGYQVVLVPEAENRLPEPIRLPELQPENDVPFDNTSDAFLTIDGIAGVIFQVQAGSMTLADGTVPDAATPVVLSVNTVQVTDIPMPLPNGAAFPIAWTLQPSGATFDPPVKVTLPNAAGLPPGAAAYLLSFDHDIEAFSIVANASVSDDGLVVETNPGDGIAEAGWGGVCPPYPPRTTVVGQTNPRCDESTGFFESVLSVLSFLDQPCGQIADPLLRRSCNLDFVACLQGLVPFGIAQSGTLSGGTPADELRLLADDALRQHLEFQATVNGSTVPGFTSMLASGAEYHVSQGAPGRLADATIVVDFDFAPDLFVGDVFSSPTLAPYAPTPGAATFEVLSFPLPNRATIRVLVASFDRLPRATVFAGGRSARLRPDGSFVLQNVPATAELPLRPLVIYEGSDLQRLLGPSSFSLPLISGTTDFGSFSLLPEPLRRTELDVAPAVTSFVSLGASSPLDVTATLEDGSLLAAAANVDGSGYTISDTGVVAVDAFGTLTAVGPGTSYVTVSNEGTAETVTAVVAPGDPLTTVAGVVTRNDGITPVAGASVQVFPGDLSATTASDGSFSIANVPTILGELTLRVVGDVLGTPAVASLSGVAPQPGVFTDVGIVALATPVFWVQDANGSWDDGANWSTGVPPAAGDLVLIDRAAVVLQVTIPSLVQPRALFCEENLRVTGTLEVTDPFQANGQVILDDGTIRNTDLLASLSGTLLVDTGDSAFDGVRLGLPTTISNRARVTVSNGLELAGVTISLQSASAGSVFSELIFSGPQALSGTGAVEFTSGSLLNGLLVAGGPLTIEEGVKVRGLRGTIGPLGETVHLRSSIVSTGNSLIRVSADLRTEGASLLAGAGQIQLNGTVDNLDVLTLDGETEWSGHLRGGAIEGSAGAQLFATPTSSLEDLRTGVDIIVPPLAHVMVANGLTLEGAALELQANGAIVRPARVTFAGTQSLAGNGEVVFSTETRLNELLINGGTLTIESGVTIRGLSGRVGSPGEALVLRSSIIHEGASHLELRGDVRAENVSLSAPGGSFVEIIGDVDLAGTTLTIADEVRLEGSLAGGTVMGTGGEALRAINGCLLDGITLQAFLQVPTATSVRVLGGLTLVNSQVRFESNAAVGGISQLSFEGPQTFGGIGEVFFSTQGYNNALRVVGGPLTIDTDILIRGLRGTVGSVGETVVSRATIQPDADRDVRFQGDLVNEGRIVVGGAAGTVLSSAGTFTQNATGRIEMDLAGTAVGSGHDRLAISGVANLGGTLEVTVVAPFAPSIGQTFRPLTFASSTGAFDSAIAVGVPAGLALQLTPLATAIELEVVAAEASDRMR